MSLGIFFDNPSCVYKPGESVSGKVTAVLTEPLTATGVGITILGGADVRWNRGIRNDSSDLVRASEDFFIKTITVWGNPLTASPQAPTPILPAGSHTFNFSFPLPDGLPGTFFFKNYNKYDNYGKIEYLIKASIERPTARFDIKIELPFIVSHVYNLNLNPAAAVPPQQMDRWQDIGCWCCAAGRVGFAVWLPKSGYANGEVIAATVDIMNHSRRTIEDVTMTLMKHIRYTLNYGGSSNFERLPVQVCTRRLSVKPGKTQRMVIDELRVPNDVAIACPTLEFPPCKILNIAYTVVSQCFIDGSQPVAVETPVIIGTVPVIVATKP